MVFKKVDVEPNDNEFEAPRPRADASRQGNIIHIVPLCPDYKTGLAVHVPVTNKTCLCHSLSFVLFVSIF